jgi:glycosyltransferase involved in cell wall biosynthesis
MRPTAPGVAGRPLRVLLWGTYDTGKPRVRLLREGLRRNGAAVLEVHHPLWDAIEDKSQVRGLRRWLKLAANAAIAYPRLVWRYLRAPPHDVVLVAYPGLLDLFVLRPFAWARRVPLAWDWFLSAYDTIVLDRRLLSPRNPAAWLIRALEWSGPRLANVTFMDTAAHARRMEQVFGLPEGRIGRVWVGAEEARFSAGGDGVAHGDDAARPFTVLFYGQFIPLHGADVIVEAAAALRDHDVDWLLVGTGQEAARIDAALARHALPRVRRVDWMPYAELRDAMAGADVVLGIFGTSDKAASVIPNKVFQAAMARRPLITRDSPALREFLPDAPPFVSLVPAGDAGALAAAVLRAKAMLPGTRIVPDLALAPFDTAAIGCQLVELLQRATGRGAHNA